MQAVNSSGDEPLSREFSNETLSFCSGVLFRLSFLNVEIDFKESYNTECPENGEQLVADVCRKVVSIILKIHSAWKLYTTVKWKLLLDKQQRISSEEEDKKLQQSKACLFYLMLAQENELDSFPQVIDPVYAFILSVPCIATLLHSKNPPTNHQGLSLCRCTCNRLEELSLRISDISQILSCKKNPVYDVFNHSCSIALHCPSKTLRQRATQLITKLLDKFIWKDRCHIVLTLLQTVTHSGLLGYLIGYYKDKMSEVLKEDSPEESKVFLRQDNSTKFMDIILSLPHRSETDLLEEYDRLMASLNCLRFIFLRDKKKQTLVWERKRSIEKDFISELICGLNLSRMHFKDEMKLIDQKKKGKDGNRQSNNLGLSSFPSENRRSVIQSALYSFDMMQGVCSRLQQILDETLTE